MLRRLYLHNIKPDMIELANTCTGTYAVTMVFRTLKIGMNTAQSQSLRDIVLHPMRFWDTNRQAKNVNRPVIIIKEEKTCLLIDIAVLIDRGISAKGFEI